MDKILENGEIKVDISVSNETLIRLAVTAILTTTIILLTLTITQNIKK